MRKSDVSPDGRRELWGLIGLVTAWSYEPRHAGEIMLAARNVAMEHSNETNPTLFLIFPDAFIQTAKQWIKEIGHHAAPSDLQFGRDRHAREQLGTVLR